RDFWTDGNSTSLSVGDFNRDGLPDVVAAHLDSNNVAVLLNNTPQKDDGVTIVRDIVYYNGPGFVPDRHVLNLYLPAGQNHHHFPVVFLAYGGAGQLGHKSRLGYLARTLAREGIGVVTPDTRLTDGTPQQVVGDAPKVEDLARAFRWTYDHIEDYKGDRDSIVLLGHSSGAIYVTLLALNPRFLAEQGLSADLIRGVIDFSGLYLSSDPDVSAIPFLGARQPPFQIFYTDRDSLSTRSQSVQLYDALVAAHSEAELHPMTNRTHDGLIAQAANPGDPARELVLQFVAAHTG